MKSCLTLIFLLNVLTNSSLANTCKEIIVSAHHNYPPYQWSEEGEIKGASVEVLRKILKNKKIIITSQFIGPWKRVLKKAELGEIDLILALKKNLKRQKYLEFTSEQFYTNPMVVISSKNINYTKWNDLSSYKGVKNRGDSYGQKFDNFIEKKLTLLKVERSKQAFKLLSNGRFDYYITGLYPALSYIKLNNSEKKYFVHRPYINNGAVHHAFSKKSSCRHLNKYISKKLKELNKSGEIKKQMDSSFSQWLKFKKKRKNK